MVVRKKSLHGACSKHNSQSAEKGGIDSTLLTYGLCLGDVKQG